MDALFETVVQLLEKGLYLPVLIVVICGLLYFILDSVKKDSARREALILEESSKRDQTLKELIDKSNEDSREREDKLMLYLEKTNESHAKIANAMERLEMRMEYIEEKLNRMA